MLLTKPLRSNLRFLLVEVDAQLQLLQHYLRTQDSMLAQQLNARSGYACNLHLRIQNGVMAHAAEMPQGDALTLRAVASIASEVMRISDLARDGMQQLVALRVGHRLDLIRFVSALQQVSRQIKRVEGALLKRDTRLALKIGRGERKVSRHYHDLLRDFTAQLQGKKHPEDLVTGLFIARMVVQMGAVLLRISEAIISNNIGQPIDMRRFQVLQQTVDGWSGAGAMAGMTVEPLAETRSGSSISTIHDAGGEMPPAIYKDGDRRKLKEEIAGVECWHAVAPGVAPKVLAYNRSGDSASLLIEHLPGMTFEQIVLHEPVHTMAEAMQTLGNTVTSVWHSSRKKKRRTGAAFMQQMRKRLADVYAVHPTLRQDKARIGTLVLPSLESLLVKAEKVEKRLQQPRSVLIHGDFNVDNILYDPQQGKVHFIDLHRAAYMDYVQDVSVFMVSNYRLQVFAAPVRRRIRKQVEDFYAVTRAFANKHGDDTFELRLALGLARSFATSTRFILDASMARKMFLRAHYLLARVVRCDLSKPQHFVLPIRELFGD